MAESMVKFQVERREALRRLEFGDLSVPRPATGTQPADLAQASKRAHWWTDTHLNLTRSLADVWRR
jgi:hypothetical protein